MEITHGHQGTVVAAVDVHYLGSGGARAAIVLASDVSFSVIVAERTVLVPEVAPYAVPILRGTSARPLFITAAGMPLADAASMVRQMAGPFRLPEALRRVDALARGVTSA
jgi:deoxyinosine 3'endonuclease (endonuclease V)